MSRSHTERCAYTATKPALETKKQRASQGPFSTGSWGEFSPLNPAYSRKKAATPLGVGVNVLGVGVNCCLRGRMNAGCFDYLKYLGAGKTTRAKPSGSRPAGAGLSQPTPPPGGVPFAAYGCDLAHPFAPLALHSFSSGVAVGQASRLYERITALRAGGGQESSPWLLNARLLRSRWTRDGCS